MSRTDTLIFSYLAAHLAVYVFFLRHLGLFSRERAIFLYHFVSLLGVLLFFGESFSKIISVMSLHGIYSLSFLELWALSQGGYSLRILEGVHQAALEGKVFEINPFKELGESKKKGRIHTLRFWHLVRLDENSCSLTLWGRLFAMKLSLISWPSRILRRVSR